MARAGGERLKAWRQFAFEVVGIRLAELHWYEAHGIGRKEIKRKGYLD